MLLTVFIITLIKTTSFAISSGTYNLKNTGTNLDTPKNVPLVSNEFPKEVKERIVELNNNPNIKSISVETTECRYNDKLKNSDIRVTNWGNPYKGYKNLYFKDWIVKSHGSTGFITIKNGRWGFLSNEKISKIITAGTGLLIGGVSKKAGIAISVYQIFKKVLPNVVYPSSQVRFYTQFIVEELIDKYTYVREGSTGQYQYGALTQKAKYTFDNYLSIPGKHSIVSKGKMNYIQTENFSNPDKKAWNAVYSPWIERLGHIKYGGVYFSF